MTCHNTAAADSHARAEGVALSAELRTETLAAEIVADLKRGSWTPQHRYVIAPFRARDAFDEIFELTADAEGITAEIRLKVALGMLWENAGSISDDIVIEKCVRDIRAVMDSAVELMANKLAQREIEDMQKDAGV